MTANEAGLLAASFVPATVRRLVTAVAAAAESEAARTSCPAVGVAVVPTSGGGAPVSDAPGPRVSFAADVIGRLCRRGHAALASAALWEDLGEAPAALDSHQAPGRTTDGRAEETAASGMGRQQAAQAVILAVPDRATLDKLLEALLHCLDTPG